MKNFLFNLKMMFMLVLGFALVVSGIVNIMSFVFDGEGFIFLIIGLVIVPLGLTFLITFFKQFADWME